jgi:hypothetical protein
MEPSGTYPQTFGLLNDEYGTGAVVDIFAAVSGTGKICSERTTKRVNWSDPINLPVTSQRLKVAERPSAPPGAVRDGLPPDTTPPWTNIVATGDYVGTYGVDPELAGAPAWWMPHQGRRRDGITGRRGTAFVLPTWVVPGLSNTLHITESAGRPDFYRNGRRDPRDGDEPGQRRRVVPSGQ